MTSIAGGKQLTTLNLTHANQQLIFENDYAVPALLYAKSTLALDGILAYVIDVTNSDKIVTSVYKLV